MGQAREKRTKGAKRYRIETPEHVAIEFEVAGLGSRAVAMFIDSLFVALVIMMLVFTAALVPEAAVTWLVPLVILLFFAAPFAYFTLFEWKLAGKTPGKRYAGIRVISRAGHLIGLRQSAVRNIVRIVDVQLMLGVFFILFQRSGQRLGDMAAGTVVVHDQAGAAPEVVEEDDEEQAAPVIGSEPALSDDEFRLLDRFLERLESISERSRPRIVADLIERFKTRLPPENDPTAALRALYEQERLARQARAGAGLRRAHFGKSRRAQWNKLGALLDSARMRGAGGLTGKEVVDLAAAYRSTASDLARARTYGADEAVTEHLNLLVGAGHNFQYADRRGGKATAGEFFRGLVSEFYLSRRSVLVAFVLFLVPGVVGFTMVRQQPELASRILPAEMISRAETGLLVSEEKGYAESPNVLLPLISSRIIANNIQVAFGAFALGMTMGVGTVVVLAFNGLFLGANLGLFANYGLAAWLLTFIVGHGPLELTAIFMAGGAGLLLGRAIVFPGEFSRYDALFLAGAHALRLVALAAFFLLLAGTIEGLASASAMPAAIKVAIGAASAVLIGLILVMGKRLHNTTGMSPEPVSTTPP